MKIKNISVFILLLTAICLISFMNCAVNEGLIDSEFLGSSHDEVPPYKYTENPPSGQFPDPDDPTNKSKIVSPEGLDINSWSKTSEITDIDINIENGQICISHTKAGGWNPTQNVGSSSVEDPVEGNAWIIVPLDGKGYTATYDWLGFEEPCHMLDIGTLNNLYEQLPQLTDTPELANWKPLPGDKIGFMVSGFARDGLRNVEERSNMLVVTLPDADGKVPINVEKPCSQDPESLLCPGNCNVPNKITVIDSIVYRAFHPVLPWIHQLYTERTSKGPESIDPEDKRWEFMDRVAHVLNNMDDRFGYTCIDGNCDDISTHQIAYKCDESEEGEVEGSDETIENIATVSILTQDGKTQWQPDTQDATVENDNTRQEEQTSQTSTSSSVTTEQGPTEETDESVYSWIYPREGFKEHFDCVFFPESFFCQLRAAIVQAINSICASGGNTEGGNSFNPDNFSWNNIHWLNGGVIYNHDISEWSETSRITSFEMTKNGFCMDHTKRTVWSESYIHKLYNVEVTLQGTQNIIIPYQGGLYGVNFDDLRLPDDPVGSMCAHHMRYHRTEHVKEQGSDTIKQTVMSIVGSVKRIWLGGSAQRAAIAPIKDWYPRPGDVLGFVVSSPTHPRKEAKLKERSDIIWVKLPNYCQDSSSLSGEIIGRTSSLDDDDNNQNTLSTACTQEQLDSGYGTHPETGQCLPRCITFAKSNAEGVEIGEGDACNDTANYHILPIENTFEDKCCRRYSKTSCPPGHRTHNGSCYPTCQQAAQLAGHTNRAGHNQEGNYVLHEKQTFASDANCRALDEYGPNGYNDWQDFSFYDPYTFKTLRNNSNTIYEIVVDPDDDYLCCIRSTPNTTKAPSYGSDGQTEEERNRFPTTTTTTTTSSGSNSNTCQNDNDCSSGYECKAGECKLGEPNI